MSDASNTKVLRACVEFARTSNTKGLAVAECVTAIAKALLKFAATSAPTAQPEQPELPVVAMDEQGISPVILALPVHNRQTHKIMTTLGKYFSKRQYSAFLYACACGYIEALPPTDRSKQKNKRCYRCGTFNNVSDHAFSTKDKGKCLSDIAAIVKG